MVSVQFVIVGVLQETQLWLPSSTPKREILVNFLFSIFLSIKEKIVRGFKLVGIVVTSAAIKLSFQPISLEFVVEWLAEPGKKLDAIQLCAYLLVGCFFSPSRDESQVEYRI